MSEPPNTPWDSGWMVLPPTPRSSRGSKPHTRADQLSAALEVIRHATGYSPGAAGGRTASAASEIVAIIKREATLSGHTLTIIGRHYIAVSWVWSGVACHSQTLAVRLRMGRGLWSCQPCDGICAQASWEWSSILTRPALARDPWHPLLWHPTDPARPSDTVAALSAAIVAGGRWGDPAAWRALSDAYRDCGLEAQAEYGLDQAADGLAAPPSLRGRDYDGAWDALF